MQYHKTSMLKDKELQSLKKRLPRGYFKKTIQKSEMSERSVANFFSGKSYSLEIHLAAIEVAEEYEAAILAALDRSKPLSDAR
jgi:hypothetical protein